ncbi:VOC family protein [Niveibacterium sp. 24ML]|uniref:VOC family protein n=1 Tax=Niveibacterium sp. 24ML TaxID=2985512 RepID=UPI00226ED414|nr:VOC family protein [Niveibacterium sp. 24ML]MCX9157578.1 VOC family protein [Niveibacterium sp. 24ML]
MKIEHVAIWTTDLEAIKDFYVERFGATASAPYRNENKGFSSYFLSFGGGARLELMNKPGIPASRDDPHLQRLGLIHLAISVGSKDAVDRHHARSVADGLCVVDGPRWTGDGYYEYVLLDPEDNRIEVTI